MTKQKAKKRFETVTSSGRTLSSYAEDRAEFASRIRAMGEKIPGKIYERTLEDVAIEHEGDVFAREPSSSVRRTKKKGRSE